MADQQKQPMPIDNPLWLSFMAQYQKRQQKKRKTSQDESILVAESGMAVTTEEGQQLAIEG